MTQHADQFYALGRPRFYVQPNIGYTLGVLRKKPLPGYRLCVGIMLLNAQGQVFIGHRIHAGPDSWQMPQGGVNPGEEPGEAALRELMEETGVRQASMTAEILGWAHYDLPAKISGRSLIGRYRGQAQRWFALRWHGCDSEISLDGHQQEFDRWRWVDIDELVPGIIGFKRDVYRVVVEAFRVFAQPLPEKEALF